MNKKIIILLFLITLFLVLSFIPKVKAQAPMREITYPPSTVMDMADYYAVKYGVDKKVVRKVLSCESNFDVNNVGDYGHSFGVSQIYLPAHPEITKEQAIDPNFALDFLAKNLKAGHGKMWTCYRMFYK